MKRLRSALTFVHGPGQVVPLTNCPWNFIFTIEIFFSALAKNVPNIFWGKNDFSFNNKPRLGTKLSQSKSTNLYSTKWWACPSFTSNSFFFFLSGNDNFTQLLSIHENSWRQKMRVTGEKDGRISLVAPPPHCYCWGWVARDSCPTTWPTYY